MKKTKLVADKNAGEMKGKKEFHAFIDFYNRHNVIPVSQNIEEVNKFNFRRNYLYSTLGSPLSHFRNRSVIEFGPGGGFNATATCAYRPALYTFVDASDESLKQLHSRNNGGKFNADNVEIVEANIYDYKDSRKFDFVIIEGTVCGQAEPHKMLRHVSTFVNEGGNLITTTTSATSVLSEICRKLLKVKIEDAHSDFESQVLMGASVFKSHLDSLETSTRPINDWVIDVILNDWHRGYYTFSLVDAVEALGNDFDFYNSSPSFLTDDRWYKKVTSTSQSLSALAIDQYADMSACLLDYRIPLKSDLKSNGNGVELELLCKLACDVHDDIITCQNYGKLNEFFRLLKEIHKLLPDEFQLTGLAIQDFISTLPKYIENPKVAKFSHFSEWWGRGQQYVSFVKK